MARKALGVCLILIAPLAAGAQQGAPRLTFDAASVRVHPSAGGAARGTEGGPGSRDPGRYVGNDIELRLFLCAAFAVTDCSQQVSGPSWIDSERYDLAATMPAGATKAQFEQMLQNLLIDRFQLVLRHETRNLATYELTVAHGGPKLTPSAPQAGQATSDGPPGTARDPEGYPILPPGQPGFVTLFSPGPVAHATAQFQSMAILARWLGSENPEKRPVLDKTGLAGRYDFHLVFALPSSNAAGTDAPTEPDLAEALVQQLGLRLASATAAFDCVIVDSGDKVPGGG